MKIIVFGGGLGNQIFGYAFFRYLTEKGKRVYGVYNKRWLNEHHGLELNTVFEVNLPPSTIGASIVSIFLFLLKKIGLCKNRIDMGTRTFNPNAIVYHGCKANKRFIPDGNNWIKFKDIALNEKNQEVLEKIMSSNSVFIHVRKGDYLSDRYRTLYEGTCPLIYYRDALALVEKTIVNPNYFVFSDDIEWTKENISLSNATYICWNTGTESYIDMFLMSNCKAGIMANSTFSFWGAKLGCEKQVVTYPEKWINTSDGAPDIFPDSWIKL